MWSWPMAEKEKKSDLDGEFDEELEGLKKMSVEELKDLYKKRDIEPT